MALHLDLGSLNSSPVNVSRTIKKHELKLVMQEKGGGGVGDLSQLESHRSSQNFTKDGCCV